MTTAVDHPTVSLVKVRSGKDLQTWLGNTYRWLRGLTVEEVCWNIGMTSLALTVFGAIGTAAFFLYYWIPWLSMKVDTPGHPVRVFDTQGAIWYESILVWCTLTGGMLLASYIMKVRRRRRDPSSRSRYLY